MNIQTVLPVLLSWASHLSGYPVPDQPPTVRFEPHGFFVEHVCSGRECNAVGWYNDRRVIYIDEKYRDDDDGFASSLLVHELTHYLQHQSGKFDSHSCDDSLYVHIKVLSMCGYAERGDLDSLNSTPVKQEPCQCGAKPLRL